MILGGGQDNPAGLSSTPDGKINQLGYLTPGLKISWVGARYPGGASCPGGGGGQDKLLHRHQIMCRNTMKLKQS